MSKAKTLSVDRTLLIYILAMLGLGLLFLYSASVVLSFSKYGSNTRYFLHQLIYGAIPGLILLYIASKIDYHFWQKAAPYLIFFCVASLIAVLIPGVGYKVGGAKRWIQIGGFSFQAAEYAKLALIFFIASWLDKRAHSIKDFSAGLIPLLLIIGFVLGLIFLQPDIGTLLVTAAIAFSMLFVGGSQVKHLMWILGSGLILLALIVKLEPYRIARFTTFLDPSADPTGVGYQINQALVAIGSSGFLGYGYGRSRQKYNFLPEVMGDSVFAVTVEELGFIRAGIFVVGYLLLALRGLKIAKGAPDAFGKMVAVGIIAWISFQALINIGAIIGVLPLTGVPLPFVSYGSTALWLNLAAMGVLLNISKHSTV